MGGGHPKSGQTTSFHHVPTISSPAARRKPRRSSRGGFLLVEGTISLGILALIGVLLLQLSLSILQPRQWTMQQAVSDAYMTYERALAERVPFNDAVDDGSLWPEFPETASEQVEMGRLPGGRPITATVTRTRMPDPNNLPQHGGTGDEITNPSAMRVWRLQSVVSYRIGHRMYYKSRTVLRAQ